MTSTRGRRVALAAGACAIAVIAGTGFVFREDCIAYWYLFRLGSWDEKVREEAAERLGELRSRRAIPRLVPLVGKSPAALRALMRIGPPGVAALLDSFAEGSDRCAEVAQLLFDLPSEEKMALAPALAVAWRETRSEEKQVLSLKLLIQMRLEAEVLVPAFTEILTLGSPELRGTAALALGRLGSKAKGAVPALIERLKDVEGVVRARAIAALGHIGADAAVALPAVLAALNDDDEEVRRSAALAPIYIAKETSAETAIPALIALLEKRGGEGADGAAAMQTLGAYGSAAAEAVPVLKRIAQRPDPQEEDTGTRRAAETALKKITGE